MEVHSMLYLAEDLAYLSPKVARTRQEKTLGLSGGIESLAKTLRPRKRDQS